MELFCIFFVPLLILNVFTFVMFAGDYFLSKKGYSGWRRKDDKAVFIAIGGAIGAFIALHIFKFENRYDDGIFKIAVPICMAIQIITLGYLFLLELGIVK